MGNAPSNKRKKKNKCHSSREEDIDLEDYVVDEDYPDEGLSLVQERLDQHTSVLDRINGQPGDVPHDPALYYGIESLTFKDVRFAVEVGKSKLPCLGDGEEKVILDTCSGNFGPGELVAVMGPSGCGKSTLVDILADKKTAGYDGEVHVNGHERDEFYTRITTYVPQEDIFFEHMTVREVVEFNDYLKAEYPFLLQSAARDGWLDMLISDLGLSHVSDTKIGGQSVRGISGGQKRRVTLLKSYVTMANIIYADEPTSGLSATDTETCVKTMRFWAKTMGTTILVVIHQPRLEVARLFDRLLLLTANPGRMVYDGPMKDALEYWKKAGRDVPKNINPTDYYLDTVTPGYRGAEPDKFVTLFKQQLAPRIYKETEVKHYTEGPTAYEMIQQVYELLEVQFGEMPEPRESKYATGPATQFRRILGRALVLEVRGWKNYAISLALTLIKSFGLGIGFLNIARAPSAQILVWIYGVVLIAAFGGMENMPKMVDERIVMKMETTLSLYSPVIFVAVTTLITETVNFVFHVMFILIMYAFAAMDLAFFWPYVLWTTLAWFCFDSLFGMVAALGKDSGDAQALAVPFVLISDVYNGFTVSLATAPVWIHWLLYISPTHAAISQLTFAARDAAPGAPEGNATLCEQQNCQENWDAVINTFQMEDNLALSLVVLIGWTIIFRILQVIFTRYLNNIEK